MIEKSVIRNGKRVVEVRSDGGKLLYIKTREGYEMKCPRTKQICLVRYEDMLSDCMQCLENSSDVIPKELQKFQVGSTAQG